MDSFSNMESNGVDMELMDAKELDLAALKSADGYIIGTPNYFSAPSGYIKIFFDELFLDRILDANEPSNVIQVGVFDDGGSFFGAYVNGTTAYLADYQNGLKVVDASDPSNLTKIAQFSDGGHAYDVDVINNIAYIADRDDGLEIIEIMI